MHKYKGKIAAVASTIERLGTHERDAGKAELKCHEIIKCKPAGEDG